MAWWTLLAAYLLGSIPTGVLVAKSYGVDLTAAGSGNIGATNALRVIGKKAGAITLIGDMLKGSLAVGIAMKFGGRPETLLAAGAAVVGHDFTVFRGFRGGKGVATSIGVMLPVAPLVTLMTACVWLAAMLIWRYSSLAALASFAALPMFVAVMVPGDIELWGLALFVTVLATVKHRSNIMRLLKGEEPRIGSKAKGGVST